MLLWWTGGDGDALVGDIQSLAPCPDENRQHSLTTCVFACQFWFQVHSPFGLQDCVPHCNSPSFAEWWPKTIKSVPFVLQVETEGAQFTHHPCSLDVMEAHKLCVFDGQNPDITSLHRAFKEEHHLWCLAGAMGLLALGLGHSDVLG
jgi:hypothetical protein